jgi:tetratricopeptide (TPR) repeat protein
MPATNRDLRSEISEAVRDYETHANVAELRARLQGIIGDATPDALVVAAEPFREQPDVAGTLYERIVELDPKNARAMVVLANAWWLSGRGPDAVGELATRAISVDPSNRGAWHLWALSESDPRQRTLRWQQVARRFPGDLLALANVADNAAAVAGAEQDYGMLDLAVATYEELLRSAEVPAQRDALETALRALKGWKF